MWPRIISEPHLTLSKGDKNHKSGNKPLFFLRRGSSPVVVVNFGQLLLDPGCVGRGSGWDLRVRPAAAVAASGNLEIWESGNLGIWRSGDLKSKKVGDLGTWKSRNLGSKKWETDKFPTLKSVLPKMLARSGQEQKSSSPHGRPTGQREPWVCALTGKNNLPVRKPRENVYKI